MTAEEVAAMPTPFDRDPRRDDPEQARYYGDFYGGNRAMASVFRKGALAAVEGEPLDALPYGDDRTYRGGVTFARAFQRAWCEGWHVATYGDGDTCTLIPNHAGPCSFDPPTAPHLVGQ